MVTNFYCCSEKENFRETTEQRFITQSTVSKHIQHLEKELQTTLLNAGKNIKLNQTEVIKNFVKQGLGIAFLPKSVIETELHQQLLHSYSLKECSHIVSNTYCLTKYVTKDVEAFIAVCHLIYKDVVNN